MIEKNKESTSVTLSDVAREAGVSLATASRVVNGSTRKVAEEYRVRVLAAAESLGYTANMAAQATARGTSSTVVLLVADIADPYFGLIASGVARGAEEAGLVMTIAVTGRQAEREARMARSLRGQRPRSVIVASSRVADEGAELATELSALENMGSRVVLFGGDSEGSIVIDNFGGARDLGEAMYRIGYRRAIVLAAAAGVRTSDDRLAGFTAGFGGEITRVYRGAFTRESGAALMTQAIANGVTEETLIFGVSDVVAIGAMTAARDAGLAVGSQVAFCGFDDVPVAHDVSPGLTTVRVSLEEVGYRAFQMTVSDDLPRLPALQVVLRASTPGVQ